MDVNQIISSGRTIGGASAIGHTYRNDLGDSILHDDQLSDEPSSPDSSFDHGGDLMDGVHDDITHQLAHSGPVGMAAAAAIASCRRRKKPHHFETNPSIRKRQQTRLLRKLKVTLEEYTTRVGQQAVLLAVTPSKGREGSQSYKVFGSQPLENVVRNCRAVIVQELEQVLAHHTPQPVENPNLFELPPLTVDGMPTSLEKMTQAQLRMFVPEMLKYSTGRSKPGWGKPEFKPVWWPSDLPWANVRCDERSDEQKKQVSWTFALRSIVRNCYKHHGREDLLPSFEDPSDHPPSQNLHTVMQTINNPDGTLSIIQIDTGTNPFAGHQVVTLADGTQAAVVQTLQGDEVMEAGDDHDLTHNFGHVTEATLQQDGSIILTDGTGLSTEAHIIPASVYQTVVSRANIMATSSLSENHNRTGDELSGIPESEGTVEIIANN